MAEAEKSADMTADFCLPFPPTDQNHNKTDHQRDNMSRLTRSNSHEGRIHIADANSQPEDDQQEPLVSSSSSSVHPTMDPRPLLQDQPFSDRRRHCLRRIAQARRNQRLASLLRQTRRGDMYVEANVEIPVNLNSKQKAILQEFEKEGGTSKKHSPKSQSFFSKLKEVWEDLT